MRLLHKVLVGLLAVKSSFSPTTLQIHRLPHDGRDRLDAHKRYAASNRSQQISEAHRRLGLLPDLAPSPPPVDESRCLSSHFTAFHRSFTILPFTAVLLPLKGVGARHAHGAVGGGGRDGPIDTVA